MLYVCVCFVLFFVLNWFGLFCVDVLRVVVAMILCFVLCFDWFWVVRQNGKHKQQHTTQTPNKQTTTAATTYPPKAQTHKQTTRQQKQTKQTLL